MAHNAGTDPPLDIYDLELPHKKRNPPISDEWSPAEFSFHQCTSLAYVSDPNAKYGWRCYAMKVRQMLTVGLTSVNIGQCISERRCAVETMEKLLDSVATVTNVTPLWCPRA
ncbi:unnamed protein product [Dicrocoelium dendriticum]|nr:unnamed protein product [Dicrocoelium dendriticum]